MTSFLSHPSPLHPRTRLPPAACRLQPAMPLHFVVTFEFSSICVVDVINFKWFRLHLEDVIEQINYLTRLQNGRGGGRATMELNSPLKLLLIRMPHIAAIMAILLITDKHHGFGQKRRRHTHRIFDCMSTLLMRFWCDFWPMWVVCLYVCVCANVRVWLCVLCVVWVMLHATR